ncbi:MAG TPA: gliding motility-associated C-terminal domain-containing protein [Chitinophagaceae bacterium]|nr:gliding motility-associated C-terminal domain-containing protein [Chitinophagaceae bacterium]
MRINHPSLFLACIALLFSIYANSQPAIPPIQWAQQYGGSAVDVPFVIKFTADGGTIAGGYTDSKDGDINPHTPREYWDLWVAKLDRCGNLQWERSFGGTGYESARDILPTEDGGYLILGETNSTNGGVTAGFGGTKDIWLLKLSAAGNLEWQRRYGGNGLDIGNNIVHAGDGGYLIAASSSSNDGQITGNHGTGGYTDGVLMKVSANGSLLWSKCFGGSKNEELFDIEIIDGRIFLAGFTNSVDGDIPPSQKNYDAWLLALDASGNKIFSRIYGGSQNDVIYSMTRGLDGSLTLAGYTTSNDGDVSGAKGSQDYWVINVSQQGNLNWQKVLGGTEAEFANNVITDEDGGYIIGGISYSDDGDVNDARGEGDFWTVKLAVDGTLAWKKTWGGSGSDHLRYMIHDPVLNEYYFAGDSGSGDGDFSNLHGETDFAIIKLKIPELATQDTAVCTVNGFVPYSDTLYDACGYDSVLVSYQPVAINNPFENIRNRDTIFAGQSTRLFTNANANITWEEHASLSCYNCPDPIANPNTTTVFTAINQLPEGCQVTGEFTVVVLNDAVVLTPTAFTPNADGLNDFFGPLGKVPDQYTLKIFNRNGEMVFKSSAMQQRWDGRFRGQLQPSGVFIYMIDYKDMQNKLHQQKGTFTLIR